MTSQRFPNQGPRGGRVPGSGKSPNLSHRSRDFIDTVRVIRKPKPRPNTDWLAVVSTLPAGDPGSENGGFHALWKNNWHSAGAPYPTNVEFYMSEHGEVRFHGHITGGQVPSVVFVLPESYRPAATETFIVPHDGGGSAVIEIDNQGNVTVTRVSQS